MLHLTHAGCWLVHLHLQSGPDLNQKFYVLVTLNASSVCYTSRSKLLCSRQQMTYNGMRAVLSITLELDRGWLVSIPGQPSVNAISHAHPWFSVEIFAGVNGPFDFKFAFGAFMCVTRNQKKESIMLFMIIMRGLDHSTENTEKASDDQDDTT